MTQKDYFLLTRVLKESKLAIGSSADPFFFHFTKRLMEELKKDNPAFSETKFKIALFDVLNAE